PTELYVLYEENAAFFKDLQFEIEPFGANQLKIRSVPYEFSDISYQEFMSTCLSNIKSGSQTEIWQEKMDQFKMMSCKAAIKAGKRMTPPEVQQLLQDLKASPLNFTCPHGRPLYIKFEKSDLEKLFLRR
ncbi:MAG: hypothetical protein HRT90_00795, partial [Candidatus Margulisbacteria bacterium]|nr:hypothetical protein [Candidatus Margulisiibacteriota bacterium]